MTPQPRVLVVSPIPSHPPDQGNAARILALATELMARGIYAEFFYYGMEGLAAQQRAEMEAFWNGFHFMPSLPHPHLTFPRFWGLDDWCPTELCTAVGALHAARHYDAILVNYVWMSRVLEDLADTYRILDTHDLFGDRHLVSVREKLEPRWFFTSVAEENCGFARADLVLGIQDHESALIRARTAAEVITVGHSVPPLFLTDIESSTPIATFGYLGSGNEWNVRSVLTLDAALGPGGDIDWLLAGSISRKPLHLTSNPYSLGIVSELADFYRRIECVVNPMMGGTGLKIKTVEALAYGKPVIGTADAFIGLPARHAAHRLKSAAECAAAMRAYQHDGFYRASVQQSSRVAALTYIAKVGREIDDLRDRILAGAVAPAGAGR